VLLHDGEVADDDLGARADEHLALATLLSVDNVVEAVGLFKGGDGVSFLSHQQTREGGGRELTRTETRMATRSEGAS
jgi:hypothetical protein